VVIEHEPRAHESVALTDVVAAEIAVEGPKTGTVVAEETVEKAE
jgi:hypothetical protein